MKGEHYMESHAPPKRNEVAELERPQGLEERRSSSDCFANRFATYPCDFSFALRERILQVSGWKDQLLGHLSSMMDSEGPPMLLISGNTGCGTSVLAGSLRYPVVQENGCFLRAKFDHLMLPIPYEALRSAFTEFIKLVLSRGESEVVKIRNAIRDALSEGEIFSLQRIIPALRFILGPEDKNRPVIVSKGAAKRFVHAFRKFLSALCSSNTSAMVLVLENLQWADKSSLDLLSTWREPTAGLQKLILIGTCDPTGLAIDSHLSEVLRNMEDFAGRSILQLECSELTATELLQVANELVPNTDAEDLGSLLYGETKGSILALDMLGRKLRDERIAEPSMNGNGTWLCDLDALKKSVGNATRREFLSFEDLCDLSRNELHVVKVLCCLGVSPQREVIRCLWEKRGIQLLSEDCRRWLILKNIETRYLIYKLISNDERKKLHLEIGRSLLVGLDQDQLDRHLFVALSQLYLARPLTTLEENWKPRIASLCLCAAKKAAQLSAFRTACLYLEFGVESLGSECWQAQYAQGLVLHNALVEMHSCLSDRRSMNEIIDGILTNASCHGDKLQAYAGRVYAEGVVGHHRDAFYLGLEAMRFTNESIPVRCINFHLRKDMFVLQNMLRRKSNQQILRIHSIKDENKLACMRILQLMMTFSAQAGQNAQIFALIVTRLMKMTLKYGMSVFASLTFAEFGLVHTKIHREWRGGYRYGELALQLQEKHGSLEYLPRVYLIFFHHLSPLKNHIRRSIEPLRLASRIAFQAGDYETMGHCVAACIYAMREASVPLDIVVRYFADYRDNLMKSSQKTPAFSFVLPVMEAVYRYMGLSPDPIAGKGVLLDYDAALQEATQKDQRQIRSIILVIRAKVAYYFHEYETALRFLATDSDIKNLNTSYVCVQNAFSRGLILIAGTRMGMKTGLGKNGLGKFIKRTVKLLHYHATTCPNNFLDKAYLLEAEAASLCGRNLVAYSKYQSAISAANASNLTFYHGLANELAAHHLVRIGEEEEARHHFTDACASYARWGGTAKLSHLQAQMHSIYAGKKKRV